jgi:enediyne biosynthesis protein E4
MSEPAVDPSAEGRPAAAFTFKKLVVFRERIDSQEGKADPAVLERLEEEYSKKLAQVAAAEGVPADELDRRVHREIYGDVELVPEDDAVIGRALRWSAVAVGVLAVIALGVWLWINRPQAERAVQSFEAAAPEAVDAAAEAAVAPPLPFVDVAAERGIDFVHHNGATGDKLLPETMGGGGAFLDYDGDGDADLLLVNGAPWPWGPRAGERPTQKLYANDGAGRFTDVTAAAGLAHTFYGQGVAVGDYDNDGDPDLFFTAVGPNRLFENRGGRFAEVTAAAGVGGEAETWSTAATFFDADNDGDLDLYVGNYVRWSRKIDFDVDYRLTGVGRAYGPPANYEGTYSLLYENEGGGRFADVSAAAGVRVDNPATGQPAGKALGVVPVDADRDGWMDLFVANDTVGNFFFHNRGDGTFEETGAAWGLAYDPMGSATGAMGVDAGYHRNDGELAFVIGNFANEMTSVFVAQNDPTLYADEAIGEGIGAPSRSALSFGILLFDVDLDGRLDLLQTNGHLEEEIDKVDPSQKYRQSAQLFWNAGLDARSTFLTADPAATGDLARPIVGRGSSYADIDGDGDLDVALFQTGGAPLVLENRQELGHHWLRVDLEGDPAAGSSRDAIGARLALTAGGVTQVRHVNPTKSYLSQSERTVTFGLGEAEKVERLEITWPNGAKQVLTDLPADREIRVRQGE